MQPADPLAALWAVLLAAGASRRLGQPKQLLHWRGETLIERSLRTARSICGERVVVVLGAQRTLIEPLLAPWTARLVDNSQWAEGMASSVRAGIGALPPDCAGALLLTCDQPLLTPQSLRALAERWAARPERAVASAYADTVGVPVILPARLFGPAARLNGDRGARALLRAEGDALERVALPEAELDVDDPEALRRLGGLADSDRPAPPQQSDP